MPTPQRFPGARPAPMLTPALPADGTELAFRELARVLRAAPQLKGATLLSWEGLPDEDMGPPSADARWLRITPNALPASRSTACTGPDPSLEDYEIPFALDVETSVPGTNVGESMRFARAIVDALRPSDHTARAILDQRFANLGISSITLVKPPWGPPSADKTRCDGSGRFEVSMYFQV